MAVTINSNVASLNAQRRLNKTQERLGTTFEKLSSGKRITRAKDDAAGLAIAQELTAQLKGLEQAVRNVSDGVSVAQTADAAMGESANILQRMRELAVQGANATLSDSDRAAIQSEADQLAAELDRIGGTTTFNGKNLLDGSFQAGVQAGDGAGESIDIAIGDTRAAALGVASLDYSSPEGASAALGDIDAALGQINSMRSDVGALQNRFGSAISNMRAVAENVAASRSRIEDADIAAQTAQLTKLRILQQSGLAILAQANASPQAALSLLA